MWNVNDRVKVSPDHHGSGLQNRLGTVTKIVGGSKDFVEVTLDAFHQAGIGIVTFMATDLIETKKKARVRAGA